ncbi:MAG: hypothetical protein AB1505_28800, partial [Candidatus Latescibacterota bacterium]
MAFLLRRSVFIHIPKTAGQWVASALESAGLLAGRLGVVHASPDEICREGAYRARPFRFAMVRHPLSWYQSMWAHRVDEEWGPMDDPAWFTPRWVEVWAEFTKQCRAATFAEFVRACTSHYPQGFVSTLYDVYAQDCGFVGKQERLPEDLIEALTRAGEEFEPRPVQQTPPRNVRARRPHRLADCR